MAERGVAERGVAESTADDDGLGEDQDTKNKAENPWPNSGVLTQRFKDVEGFDGRMNDVIYSPPLDPSKTSLDPDIAVYFGGDIQDFPETMEMHRDHRHYTKYSLAATAIILSTQFPSHHIVVVRPSRMQMLTFSCFDNFVPCTNTGAPEHTPNHNALNHLELLLKNLSAKIGAMSVPVDEVSFVSSTTEEESGQGPKTSMKTLRENPHLDGGYVTLIGFSKGTVVLNQFLYEFHYLKTLTPDDDSMELFLSRITNMYWLDGGHNGGKNTWITSRSLLETLKRLNIRIHVHMTPYQLQDGRRPWIGKEEKIFSENLELYGAKVFRFIHFESEGPSLDVHFRVLEEFRGVEIAAKVEEEEENDVDEDADRNCSDDSLIY